jgi:hypothetical protein
MIIVRDIFQLKFGKAKEAMALLKEGIEIMKKSGFKLDRVLTDLTGQFYTLVMESSYKSLTDYENMAVSNGDSSDWRAWYQKFVPLVESGRREMFRTVE